MEVVGVLRLREGQGLIPCLVVGDMDTAGASEGAEEAGEDTEVVGAATAGEEGGAGEDFEK